ncbi:MAG TPA: polysaccharide biosynthesis/export family protein [Methylomirabilota bacterium]|nr:polysaccharide biosynthesis/export family protein [Methylomirabilota bacterium]
MKRTFSSLMPVLAIVTGLLLSTATANAQGITPDYVIGPEDVLQVLVWDNKDLDQVLFVMPDGKISVPLAGEIKAAGSTVAQLTETLTKHFSKAVKSPQVTVVVREIKSHAAFFVGGVGKPGPLQITREMSLLQAVSLAGGLLPTADLESAFVIRGKNKTPIDFVKLIQKSDLGQNIQIQAGDTIVVPTAEVVFVQGEVKTPGILKYTKDLTMLRAIAQTGGFTNLAAGGRVTLIRGDGTKKVNMRIDVDGIIKSPEGSSDVPLEPNDIIIVPQRLF